QLSAQHGLLQLWLCRADDESAVRAAVWRPSAATESAAPAAARRSGGERASGADRSDFANGERIAPAHEAGESGVGRRSGAELRDERAVAQAWAILTNLDSTCGGRCGRGAGSGAICLASTSG